MFQPRTDECIDIHVNFRDTVSKDVPNMNTENKPNWSRCPCADRSSSSTSAPAFAALLQGTPISLWHNVTAVDRLTDVLHKASPPRGVIKTWDRFPTRAESGHRRHDEGREDSWWSNTREKQRAARRHLQDTTASLERRVMRSFGSSVWCRDRILGQSNEEAIMASPDTAQHQQQEAQLEDLSWT